MNRTADLGELLLATLSAVTVLGLLAAAGALACRRLWRGAPHLAAAYGLLPIGLAGTVLWFGWVISPRLGVLLGIAAILVAVAVLVHGVVSLARGGTLTSLVPPAGRLLALAAGILLLSLGLFLIWGGPADLFGLAQTRFSHPLPIDNQLPSMFADRLLAGQDPRQPIASWLSSDRPPLQSGLLLLVEGNTPWLPVPAHTQAFAASVVCQLLWVPAVYAAGRSLRFSPRASLAAAAFAGLSGTVLVNTIFTWPKLLSAAFVVAALAVVIELRRSPGRNYLATMAAAALAISGVLSHGTAVFALPVLAVVLWWSRRSLSVGGLAAGAATAVALYAPWLAYQHWYDPPGDRLLKWHLAGVTELDHNSFLHDLLTAYRSLPLRTIIQYKIANLEEPVNISSLADLHRDTFASTLRAFQFFTVLGALGLAVLSLAAMLVSAVRRRWYRREGPSPASEAAGLMVACAGAIGLWCLILFGPATTWVHSGSHVPILLAICLPFAWLVDRHPRWSILLGAAQAGALALLYLRPHFPGHLSWAALAVTVCGVLLGSAAIATASRKDASVPATDVPATGVPAADVPVTDLDTRDGERPAAVSSDGLEPGPGSPYEPAVSGPDDLRDGRPGPLEPAVRSGH